MSTEATRYCKDCQFYRAAVSRLFGFNIFNKADQAHYSKCDFPRARSLVSGDFVPPFCDNERAAQLQGRCGPEGQFFQPKP